MLPKHITFVVEKIAGRKGGAERVVADVANGLAERGHVVSILHHDEQPGGMPYPLNPGVSLYNLCPSRAKVTAYKIALRLRSKLTKFPPERAWVAKYSPFGQRISTHIKKHPTDAIVAVMPPAMAAVAMAEIDPTLPKIASVHSSPFNEYQNPDRWGFGTYGMHKRLEILQCFDRIGVLMPEFKEWYNPSIRDRISVVPNMIHPVEDTWKSHPGEAKKILSIGHLVDAKKHATLLDAWFSIAEEFPDWSLEIYGQGHLHGALSSKIRKNGGSPESILKGVVQDVRPLYKSASLLVHPSDQEGFGLVVGEALAAGLPAIGFADCPGINSLIQDSQTGILVQRTEEPEIALATAMRTMMHDPDGRAEMGARGPESMQPYSKNKIISTWEEFLFPGAQL